MSEIQVSFNNLETWLQAQPQNEPSTPYELNITGMTKDNVRASDVSGSLGYIIRNSDKYIDLHYTTLPSDLTECAFIFEKCYRLTTTPFIPNNITDISYAFADCTGLRNITNIPSNVRSMVYTFKGCSSLVSIPTLPNTVLSIESCFRGCTNLQSIGELPDSILNMVQAFNGCTNLKFISNIPKNVTTLRSCFCGTAITKMPYIPNTVTDMKTCFTSGIIQNTTLKIVSNIPESVTDMTSCFLNCTALEQIVDFGIPINTLKNNTSFKDCFKGCSSLKLIGQPTKESPDWHCFRLKFGASTVEGKVYDKTGTAVTIPQTSVTKSTLKLPIKTDELWFPNGYTDAQIDEIIQKVIQYRYTYWNDTDVLDPAEKNFVLWADDPDNVKTNLVPEIDVADTVQSGNMNPVTSNAVAGALNPLHIAKGGSIYADGTKANYPIIKMKDNTSDVNGNGIVIGGGGATVIGGGESADTYYSGAGLTAGSERMVVANDGTITFVSNLQDGYASRKEMTMGTDGKLTNSQGFVGNISGSSGSCTGNSASANYLTTYSADGNSNIQCLQNVFNSIPKSVGTAIRLQHGSHSMAVGWFLSGYGYSSAYGGWFVSNYGSPSFVGIDNGSWHEEVINTNSKTILPIGGTHSTNGEIWIE